MYIPDSFLQNDSEAIRTLITNHPLAALVTMADGQLEANHIPLLYLPPSEDAPQGKLLGHVAKANDVWKTNQSAAALAIFQGPEQYISPNWYPSKHETGRAVPTWNYTAIHIHGTLTFHQDAEWLRDAVTKLTDHQEAAQPSPWQVTDAPAQYIDGMLKAIVGLELHITRIEAKWKVSQNRSVEDREAVAAALDQKETTQAHQMAAEIRNR